MKKKLSEIERLESLVKNMKKTIQYSKLEYLEKEEMELAFNRLLDFSQRMKNENDILKNDLDFNKKQNERMSEELLSLKKELSSDESENKLMSVIEEARSIISKIRYPMLVKDSESIKIWMGKYVSLSKNNYSPFKKIA